METQYHLLPPTPAQDVTSLFLLLQCREQLPEVYQQAAWVEGARLLPEGDRAHPHTEQLGTGRLLTGPAGKAASPADGHAWERFPAE